MYIKSIEFINSESFPGGDVLQGLSFNPGNINLLVGEQGVGKSRFLKLLSKELLIKPKFRKYIKIESSQDANNILSNGNELKVLYFDTEHDNPRISSDSNDIDEFALKSRYISHGQTLQLIISSMLELKNSIILLDEPESGLSLKNQVKLANEIKAAARNNCQIFISTHSYVLIKELSNVSDLYVLNGKDEPYNHYNKQYQILNYLRFINNGIKPMPTEITNMADIIMNLTVGDLLEYIEKHNISKDTVITVERVEDIYFEENNWSVVYSPIGGSSISLKNDELSELKHQLDKGEISKHEYLSYLHQYIPASSVQSIDNTDILYINLHY